MQQAVCTRVLIRVNTGKKINNELVNNNNIMVTDIEISTDGKTAYIFIASIQTDYENNSGSTIKSITGVKTRTNTDEQINGGVFVSKFANGNNGEI